MGLPVSPRGHYYSFIYHRDICYSCITVFLRCLPVCYTLFRWHCQQLFLVGLFYLQFTALRVLGSIRSAIAWTVPTLSKTNQYWTLSRQPMVVLSFKFVMSSGLQAASIMSIGITRYFIPSPRIVLHHRRFLQSVHCR